MAILEVATVDEFLNIVPAEGDTVKVMADLDFEGTVYSSNFIKSVNVNSVTWDFNNKRLLNIRMNVTGGGVSVALETRPGFGEVRRNIAAFMAVGNGCVIKNLGLIDVDVTANCDFMLFWGVGYQGSSSVKFDNCNILVRASVINYCGLAYVVSSIIDTVISLNVSASGTAEGVGSFVFGASLIRVEGRVSAFGSVNVITRGGFFGGVQVDLNMSRSVVNVNARSASSYVYVFGLGRVGSRITDCIVRGNYVAKTLVVLGCERAGFIQRLFIDANATGVDAFGIVKDSTSTSTLSDCIVRMKATTSGICRYVTNQLEGNIINNFRSDRATNNGTNTTETSVLNGTYVLDEELYNISFLRDVVGFDI